MQCGAVRYIATIEIDGEKFKKPIIARTPAAARKSARKTYGQNILIHSVIRERN